MAQHDFVPAWLNFSTPQSTKVMLIQITTLYSYDNNKKQKIAPCFVELNFKEGFWKLTNVKIFFFLCFNKCIPFISEEEQSLHSDIEVVQCLCVET